MSARLIHRYALWTAFCLSLMGASWAAAQDQARYDVRFRGVTVATATLAVNGNGQSYALAGRVRSAGMGHVFSRLRFEMEAQGRRSGDEVRPRIYRDDVDTGRRQSAVGLAWSGPNVQITRQAPAPGPEAVLPSAASGTVDPLSVLWRMTALGWTGMPCGWSEAVYDGARRSELSLAPATGNGRQLSCEGRYRRIAGYPSADMADRRTFPFTTTYENHGGVWVLTEVRARSLYGPIRILRQD